MNHQGQTAQAPVAAQHSAPDADPMPPFSEYLDTLKKLGIYAPYMHNRLYHGLYDLRIRSLEELAKMPPKKIMLRGIGAKTLEVIKNVLAANGIVSEEWGIPEAKAARMEN